MNKTVSNCLGGIAVLIALTVTARAESVEITNGTTTYKFTETGSVTTAPAEPGAVAMYIRGTTAPAV